MSEASNTPSVLRSARLNSRIHWDGGKVMLCPVCGLVVPVWENANYVVDGRPVDHYPQFDEHAYYPGAFCRGARHAAIRVPQPVVALAFAATSTQSEAFPDGNNGDAGAT